MQYINPNQEHIKSALEIHVSELTPVLNERIQNCPDPFLKVFFTKYIKRLLKNAPEDLIHIQKILFRVKPDYKVYLDEKRKTLHFDANIRTTFSVFNTEINKIIIGLPI